MNGHPLLRVDGLGKRFKIYASPWNRAIEWATWGWTHRHAEFWALRNISFELNPGSCFGVIGPNGSGKTTLLKILSGVLEPTEGCFRLVAQNVYSLLELGAGFHPDLTGRDNVYQSARLLRLSKAPVSPEQVERIQSFADIGDYFDRPVRFYSSGMQVRLGFAMFAFLEPDLLIVDEALSVGDVFFQQKCSARIDAMRQAGTSFLFVSHDMTAIRRLCQETMVLNQGEISFRGPSAEAINRYHGLVFGRDTSPPVHLESRKSERDSGMTGPEVCSGNILGAHGRRHGSLGLEILAARVTDSEGCDTLAVRVKDILRFDLLILAHERVSYATAGLVLYDRFGNVVFSAGTGQQRHRLPSLEPGESLVVRLIVRFSIQAGLYTFTLGTSESGHPHDWHENLGPLEVFYDREEPLTFHGMVELPMECRHSRVEPASILSRGSVRPV